MYKTIRLIVMLTALVQLAVSQIHIGMITNLFVRDIGFYLFIFIISGLLILFNLTSMKDPGAGKSQVPMMSVVTLVSLGSGITFLVKTYGDFLVQDSVLLEDIQVSMAFIIVSMVVYLIGGGFIIIKNLTTEVKKHYA